MALSCLRHLNNANSQTHVGSVEAYLPQPEPTDVPTIADSDNVVDRDKIVEGDTIVEDDKNMEDADTAQNEHHDEGEHGEERTEAASCGDGVVPAVRTASNDADEADQEVSGASDEHTINVNDQEPQTQDDSSYKDCFDCAASDDSQDDDDREQDGDYLRYEGTAVGLEEYFRAESGAQLRYEAYGFYYHLREAESLWTPEDQSGSDD
jgi:hypothetical protein